MRIAVPVDEKSLDSRVCASFGRAPYFLFYNTVTEEQYFLDNSAVISQGGAGIRAAQVIADNGVNALLVPRCGQNAHEVLSKAEVFVYQTKPGTARQNIDEFLAEKLVLLGSFHPGLHGNDE